MLRNTWFLVGCAAFAVAAVISIIVGAMYNSTPAIGVGAVVLVATVALFISGLVDRRHLPSRTRTVT